MKVFKTIASKYLSFEKWAFSKTVKHPFIFRSILILITYLLFRSGNLITSSIYVAFTVFSFFVLPLNNRQPNQKDVYLIQAVIMLAVFLSLAYPIAMVLSFVPDQIRVLEVSEWITLYGVAFTGFVTFYTIYLSIRESERLSRENLALQSIPVISIDFDSDRFKRDVRRLIKIVSKEASKNTISPRLFFTAINKTPHIAKNVAIKAVKESIAYESSIEIPDNRNSKNRGIFAHTLSSNFGSVPFMLSNDSRTFSSPLSIRIPGLFTVEIGIIIEYFDMLGIKTHYQKIVLELLFNESYRKAITSNDEDYVVVKIRHEYSDTLPTLGDIPIYEEVN